MLIKVPDFQASPVCMSSVKLNSIQCRQETLPLGIEVSLETSSRHQNEPYKYGREFSVI
jgi:hypothetical protein